MTSALSGNPLKVTLTKNLGVLFVQSEWTNLIKEVAAGNVELKTVLTAGDKTGNDVGTIATSGDKNEIYTFTNDPANTNEVTVKFVLYCGDETKPADEIATVGTVKLTAPDMTGDLQVPEETVIEKKALTESTKLLDGFTWNDSRGKEMWPTPTEENFGTKIAADALAIYGLSMTYTVVEGSNRTDFEKYFDTTDGYTNGVLTEDAVKDIKLNSDFLKIMDGGLIAPITVKIDVKATSAWGQVIENGTTTMTITYPIGTKK